VAYDTYTRNLRAHKEQVNRDVLSLRAKVYLRTSLHSCGFEVTDLLGN
jgi:hypothetical protein